VAILVIVKIARKTIVTVSFVPVAERAVSQVAERTVRVNHAPEANPAALASSVQTAMSALYVATAHVPHAMTATARAMTAPAENVKVAAHAAFRAAEVLAHVATTQPVMA